MPQLTTAISTREQFAERLSESDQPIAAVFYADWCPYCRRFLPTFDELADQFGAEVDFVKVNVDESPELESKYEIKKIPTVLLFDDGQILERWVNEQDIAPYRQEFASLTGPSD